MTILKKEINVYENSFNYAFLDNNVLNSAQQLWDPESVFEPHQKEGFDLRRYAPSQYETPNNGVNKHHIAFEGIKKVINAYNKDMKKTKFTKDMETLLGYINELKKASTIPLQMQMYSPIVHVLKRIMDELDTEKQRYLKHTLLLIKTMMLDYGCEKLLNHEHIDAMMHVVKMCMNKEVDKSDFLNYNDYLEDYGLAIIPEVNE